ncbi:NADPH-dependent FMN reductase [Tropicibacter sp. S64]|uniref:NADPH-dependent FMN reductase n=1 Tax=Tropicibacter sp. S64 TaxID=3415122 RepID=UPI003C7EB737
MSKILIIPGSLRHPSHTCGLCADLAQMLGSLGHAATIFDQRETPLPLHDSVYHKAPAESPDAAVRSLVSLATEASGFILASPIYHNGPSGVLKNALDHLAIPQFAFKPVGLASHGGNRTSQAVDQMRLWTRGLAGHAIVTQVCTQNSDYAAGETGDPTVTDTAIRARMERFCRELSVMAQTLAVTRPALLS